MNTEPIRITLPGLLCLLLLLVAQSALAGDQTAKVPRAWTPVSANFGPGGTGIRPGVLSITDNVIYGESDGVRHYEDYLDDRTVAQRFLNVFKLRYGIADGLDIRSGTPVYNIHLEPDGKPNRTNYGVGDTTVQLRKVLLNEDKGDPFFLAMDLGAVLPTGSVGEHSVNPIGSSAWGAVGGLGATYFMRAVRFDIEAQYTTFAEGAKSFEKGDRFRWNTGLAYALSDMVDLGVESCYEHNEETSVAGLGSNDANIEWYAGPKAVFKYRPLGLNVGADVMFPVYRWYQNVKAASDDTRFELKITKAFDLGTLFD